MVPNKTIYVREADAEMWKKAEELAGGSLSGLITEAVRRYVEEEERKEQVEMETIEVELWGPEEIPYPVEFVGTWLLDPDPDETRTGEPGYDAGAYYGVALTQRGNIAIYVQHVNDGFAPHLPRYRSFEAAERAGMPSDILAMASQSVSWPGEARARQLDI